MSIRDPAPCRGRGCRYRMENVLPAYKLLHVLCEACVSDVVPVLVAVAIVLPFARRTRLRTIGWLVAYIVADDTVALVPLLLGWNFGRWNWVGQGASLLFALAIARLYFSKEEVGLRLPRSRAEVLWTVAGVVGALVVAAPPAITSPVTRPDTETFLFEATLPGPVEELVFRGVGLALLLRAFSDNGRIGRREQIIASLVTALWFTSGHVFHLEHGQLDVRWIRVLDVFPMAIWYVVVRLRSGSLLGGVLAHNAANTLVETLAALRT